MTGADFVKTVSDQRWLVDAMALGVTDKQTRERRKRA
jgi:hypothetical protein